MALKIRITLLGEHHPLTAVNYFHVGVLHQAMKNYQSALDSYQKALEITLKLYGEEHPATADSYNRIGITQHEMKDYKSALESKQKALDIRSKLQTNRIQMSQQENGDNKLVFDTQAVSIGDPESAVTDYYRIGDTIHSFTTVNDYHTIGSTIYSDTSVNAYRSIGDTIDME